MVDPIQSDKSTSFTRHQGIDNPGDDGRDRPPGTQQERGSAPTTDDRVDLSDGGRLLAATRSSPGGIDSPEQARELAGRIRRQIQSVSAQAALASHTGGIDGRLTRLLEAAAS
ncbi:MAG TPA: hypothetical protein ENI96_04480 [Sedimenticola thiotaurini]|uniref:Uncharacterized protein n=1 Tax=Sedimenticola thiotaurini TaxID=1543721 RepID=A0A831RLJ7_9GAMM|nr:hypothetical protein [Sedimenticola thiotaurini]